MKEVTQVTKTRGGSLCGHLLPRSKSWAEDPRWVSWSLPRASQLIIFQMCNFIGEFHACASPRCPTHTVQNIVVCSLRLLRAARLTDHTDSKVVYRRYASLFFVCGIDDGDNGKRVHNGTRL